MTSNESTPNRIPNHGVCDSVADAVDEDHVNDAEFPAALMAERYIGGDMSDEVADAFEAALDDPALLEQLAVAVQTRDAANGTAVVARPRNDTLSRQPVSSRRLWSVLATAAAVCLCVIAISRQPVLETVVTSDQEEQVLAPVWVELADFNDESLRGEFPINDMGVVDPGLETGEGLGDEFGEIDVPDWMYAAISLPEETAIESETTL